MFVTLGLKAETVKKCFAKLVYPQPSSLKRSDVKRLFRDPEPAFVIVDLNLCVIELSGFNKISFIFMFWTHLQ